MLDKAKQKELLSTSVRLANIMSFSVYVIAAAASTLTFISGKSSLIGVKELIILFSSVIPALVIFILSKKVINELIMYASLLANSILYSVFAYTLRENPNIFIIFYGLVATSLLFIRKSAVIFSAAYVFFAITYFTFVIKVDVPPERLFGVILIRYVVLFQVLTVALFCAHSIYKNMVNSLMKEKEAQKSNENLKETLSYIAKVSDEIFNSSRELLDTDAGLSTIMSEVTAATEGISDGMEEASFTMEKINQSGKEIESSLTELESETERISGSAKEIEKRALSIQQDSESSRDTAVKLYDDIQNQMLDSINQTKVVEEISNLSNNIADIANQINLLALNAAIEAARAGEQGKGFAVVANEVRQLAVNSTATASQIKSATEKIEISISNLVANSTNLLSFINQDIIKDYDKMVEMGKNYKSDSDTIALQVSKVSENVKLIAQSISGINHSITKTSVNINTSTEASREISKRSEYSKNMRDTLNKISQEMSEKAIKLNQLAEKNASK